VYKRQILYHKKSNVSYLAHLCTYVPFPLRDASGRPLTLTGRQWQLPANCLLRSIKIGRQWQLPANCLYLYTAINFSCPKGFTYSEGGSRQWRYHCHWRPPSPCLLYTSDVYKRQQLPKLGRSEDRLR